ncbi:hypothetical protein P7K49_005020 [Saguinus oedipus]|uniref:Uncharacterized protein n=1 Tax=Saguinus oedipus TaxID=9490 RepID=A0ABQ9WBI8_SAGOE|nr:hypothetical protein P7K49_005020 [Saguinus oedipus]
MRTPKGGKGSGLRPAFSGFTGPLAVRPRRLLGLPELALTMVAWGWRQWQECRGAEARNRQAFCPHPAAPAARAGQSGAGFCHPPAPRGRARSRESGDWTPERPLPCRVPAYSSVSSPPPAWDSRLQADICRKDLQHPLPPSMEK